MRLQIITGDTSYAKDVKWLLPVNEEIKHAVDEHSKECIDKLKNSNRNSQVLSKEDMKEESIDTRGVAVSEICIVFPGGASASKNSSRINIHGRLSNGCDYDFDLDNSEKNK